MFLVHQLQGDFLPEKTLCLTFDDGPGIPYRDGTGPNTSDLAKYLSEKGIVATFFMIGKFIEKYPEVPAIVKNYGHTIGHHTYYHYNLKKKYLNRNGVVKNKIELIKDFTITESLIDKYQSDHKIYFRAPYGEWDDSLTEFINNHLSSAGRYIGPLYWDIDRGDYNYWITNDINSAEKCSKAYYEYISSERNKGIVLLHDSAAYRHLLWPRKSYNKTLDVMRILIPKLKSEGYTFIGLNEIFKDRDNVIK